MIYATLRRFPDNWTATTVVIFIGLKICRKNRHKITMWVVSVMVLKLDLLYVNAHVDFLSPSKWLTCKLETSLLMMMMMMLFIALLCV